MSENEHLVEDLVARRGVIMLMGAPDTGKTTLARQILAAAVDAGLTTAYVDADVGQSTVGPPGCAGLAWVRSPSDLATLDSGDELRFVGSTNPSRLVLQMVLATATLVEVARNSADLVVIDTTGTVSGVTGQTLKYHKVELCRPDVVVGIQRGSELEPVIGMLKRFFSTEVIDVTVDSDLVPVSADLRTQRRVDQLAAALAPPLESWRVRPTVFAPTLPAGLDLARLDDMLVGVQDGQGRCLGLGVLTYDDGVLRVLTNKGEGMKGLRLGSLRVDLSTYRTSPVNLREVMFGLES
ncbi:MAG: Clp1/GlmU family protein [Acidimicrobiia bacterium]|nr:Clp1/GlmU family protein [Acidimicrobiia bacterium]